MRKKERSLLTHDTTIGGVPEEGAKAGGARQGQEGEEVGWVEGAGQMDHGGGGGGVAWEEELGEDV